MANFSLELNKWDLLAAMQALSIYVLIRVDEGETDHNNFDALLIAAVKVGPSAPFFSSDLITWCRQLLNNSPATISPTARSQRYTVTA